ncbi:stage II sporulation protein M [Porphyrobacter algicida]|uniref:Stage II sporulation protein M n=1 Tax=Qipengyuania algicida TaxID=1836209 RepID=A0A845AHH6_9SPHN|nr:stage II sporulation protein M [Qipengyuania algicida]
MSTPVGSDVIYLNTTRLRLACEADWDRLDHIVSLLEKKSAKSLDDDDLLALPVLYRGALSSLSVARETSLDRSLARYLEQLCTRAYFQIYGVKVSGWRQVANFFADGWPGAVRDIWRETLVALLLTVLGTLLGYFLVRGDPSWFFDLMPGGMAQGRDPTASVQALSKTLYDPGKEGFLGIFATALFTHNSQTALFAFALGFAFGLPTAMLLIYNGVLLGALFAVFASKGLGAPFASWIMIHGTTELFAIMLAGAAGFRIGTAVAFPGPLARLDAAVQAGRTAGLVMLGVVAMLLVAGILEGVGRQTILVDWQRAAIGSIMLFCWLTYFYLPRRHNHDR